MDRWDVAVVGGGILGTTLAYWLAQRYDGRIAVLEREDRVGAHASSRNTGVVHRPFYLDPKRARLFAAVAQASYPMWRQYARDRALPWSEVGTLKVATAGDEVPTLKKNIAFAKANGMEETELELLDPKAVRKLEPNVRCEAALHVRTDAVVSFGEFTEALREDAAALGAVFFRNAQVRRIARRKDHLEIRTQNDWELFETRFLVNCAGGGAVDVAHLLGVGGEYADLHFRGDYWRIGERAAPLVSRNVYTVPRHGDLPFLDPHWIVRPDGRREIGPNAVPVPREDAYEGLAEHLREWPAKVFEPPVGNKARLVLSRTFLALGAQEMLSALSRSEMAERVRRFVPALRESDLVARGTAGIRSPVVDRHGAIVKEAVEVPGPLSYHILNYNSPGATGAPAYTAYLVDRLDARGDLDHLKRAAKPPRAWAWEAAAGPMKLAA